jgi:hypothetical protein
VAHLPTKSTAMTLNHYYHEDGNTVCVQVRCLSYDDAKSNQFESVSIFYNGRNITAAFDAVGLTDQVLDSIDWSQEYAETQSDYLEHLNETV